MEETDADAKLAAIQKTLEETQAQVDSALKLQAEVNAQSKQLYEQLNSPVGRVPTYDRFSVFSVGSVNDGKHLPEIIGGGCGVALYNIAKLGFWCTVIVLLLTAIIH